MTTDADAPPSAWIRRWTHLVPEGGRVLDVACGSGRHLRWFASLGRRVTGVDRDAGAVRPLEPIGEIIVADLESGPWPLPGRQFDAVVVTRYLWRPLWPALRASLAPGGVLLYETFALGQESIGKPSNPDFLLGPGELLDACAGLRVIAFEDGFDGGETDPPARFTQRIVAVQAHTDPAAMPRFRLGSGSACPGS